MRSVLPVTESAAHSAATRHAARLLAALGLASEEALRLAPPPGARPDPEPVLDWAGSGAMALTGWPDRPPVAAPAALAVAARGAARALGALAPALAGLDGPGLLGERAARLGLRRGGDVSPGGGCRLLACADGWLALNLARPDDRDLLPAWLGEGRVEDPWRFARERLRRWSMRAALARGRLLGLPVAPALDPGRVPARPAPVPMRARRYARPAAEPRRPPLVADLSSLWAGPLCAQLLGQAGARVVKVESVRRPDGAREGEPGFFDLLHAGHESVALDLQAKAGRRALHRLIEVADVVIEASRPRALAQLGIDAPALVRTRPGKVWLSITGYGRTGRQAQWVAFGDDAAAAAGLAWLTGRAAGEARPLFCADAPADPLTGLYAALAVLAARRHGGGMLLDVALARVAAHALTAAPGPEPARTARDGDGWQVVTAGGTAPVAPPRARSAPARARPLGADTAAVLREIGSGCRAAG